VIFVAAGLVLVGCGGASQVASKQDAAKPSSTATHPVTPTKLPAFYTPPKQLPGGVGRVIRYEQVAAPGVDGTAYLVMYVSEDEQGHDIPVVASVHVPSGPVPAGGFPVIGVAHPTSGIAPVCAFSLNGDIANATNNQMLQRGFEIVTSDMQPAAKPLPYIVGLVAARNVIDSVRAARQLPAAHASDNYAIWGHSEGGQAALFALEIAGSYAPELHLVGVAASAPPAELQYIYDHLGSLNHFDPVLWLMVELGFHLAYGSTAPLSQVLTPLGLSFQKAAETSQCPGPTGALSDPPTKLFKASPFTAPSWKRLMLANDPGQFEAASSVPLLILHGGADNLVPTYSSQLLAQHLCGIGQDVERWVYPGQSHGNFIPVFEEDMLTWIAHRFAGEANPDPMTPTGERGVSVSRCG
jgi:pimeloyl-ACP methyl ester carboxylesterase